MKTSERLYESVKETWTGYFEHPFVKGIGDGTLDIDKFKFYMVQDHLYLLQYAKVFAMGIVKAEKESDMRLLVEMVDEILNTENAVHQSYLRSLGISREELSSANMSLVNVSYADYMISVALKEGLAEIMTAVLACSWSYQVIGDHMKTIPGSENHEFYGYWIKSYSSKEYSDSNDVVIDMVDRLTADYTEKQLLNLEKIIIDCSRYEQMFWDMAWNREM